MFNFMSSGDKEFLKTLDEMQTIPPEMDQEAIRVKHENFLTTLEIRAMKSLPLVGSKSDPDGTGRPSPEQAALSNKFITAFINIISQNNDMNVSIRAISQWH